MKDQAYNYKKVYLIKDNKIVGEGEPAIDRGSEAGIRITGGQIFDELSQTETGKLLGMMNLFPRFSIYGGNYNSSGFSSGSEDVDEVLEYVRIVDQFNLKLGWVPDSFKDCEGYAANMTAMQEQTIQKEKNQKTLPIIAVARKCPFTGKMTDFLVRNVGKRAIVVRLPKSPYNNTQKEQEKFVVLAALMANQKGWKRVECGYWGNEITVLNWFQYRKDRYGLTQQVTYIGTQAQCLDQNIKFVSLI